MLPLEKDNANCPKHFPKKQKRAMLGITEVARLIVERRESDRG
jgi:hypothetical protein